MALLSIMTISLFKDEGFLCTDGDRIDSNWVCDGMSDCTDGEDEANCGQGRIYVL